METELVDKDCTKFVINNVKLEIPNKILTDRLRVAFETSKYEQLEARQVPRILRDGDRLLEIGAGVGYISSLAGILFKLDLVVVIEANPDLMKIIDNIHNLNGVQSKLINGVAVSSLGRLSLSESDGKAAFYVRNDFWGSSLDSSKSYKEIKHVPVYDINHLVHIYKPTVIICDIEGGEIDLFNNVNLSSVRVALFEVHKKNIGLDGIDRLSMDMRHQGLYYDPDFSVGAVVCYSRIDQ